MIKFWKNSAKGRSGCPVRPPESVNHIHQYGVNSEHVHNMNHYKLETITEDEATPSLSKKSRLTIELDDIINDKTLSNYFIQYMETISAAPFIQFYLEVEKFKKKAMCAQKFDSKVKLTRTSSLETPRDKTSDVKSSSKNNQQRRHSYWEGASNKIVSFNHVGPTNSLNSINEKNESQFTDSESETELFTNSDVTDSAIDLFKNYIALEAKNKLEFPDTVRNIIVSNICQPDGRVNENCFDIAQQLVFKQLKGNFFETFLKSPLYIKAQIDLLTNGSLTLQDILYNDNVIFYFMEYLEQESCSILLEFLIAVVNYSDNLSINESYDPDEAQNDAISLYDKYFSLQATNPIGFADDIRMEVEQNICRDGGPLPDCFHKPFRIVFKTLTNYVKSFLESELYYKFLNEMINSVDKSWKSHKKANSECSSEISINTYNTLLAMGDTPYKKTRSSMPDMTIDSNQLYNADALWQRNRQDSLNLGRVNSLGRFESKFEPDPDKKNKSVLKKMFDKFVPSSTARMEEEMAWQVAHMIVKDITDLTMSTNCGESS